MKTRGTFFFDPSDKIYNGHFPGRPVVPGSIIVHAFLEKIKGIANNESSLLIIDNFRFIRFIPPGEYNYEIIESSNGFKCILYDKERKTATGIIKI